MKQQVLQRLFAKRVLDLMVRRKLLSTLLRDEMLGGERSGFLVDGSVKVTVDDYEYLSLTVGEFGPGKGQGNIDTCEGTLCPITYFSEGNGAPPFSVHLDPD